MKVPLIVSDPTVFQGKPFIADTGVTVTEVLGWLANGRSFKQITKDHPELTEHTVKAALRYCAWVTDAEKDPAILQAASKALWDMGYGWDTEDLPPGPPTSPDMRVPMGYMGRVQGK
jgi:uncharacterized protein (DUF433 family)